MVLGGLAADKTEEYNSARENRHPYGMLLDLDAEGKALETGQVAALVAGGVLVAAGAGLLMWELLGGGGERRAAVVPLVGSGGAGLAGVVRF